MDTSAELVEETAGAALSRMLAGYWSFMENTFALMKFIEGEMTKRGWDIVKNGGYGVTRNGYGRGLSNFASAEWVTTHTGIGFVKSGIGTMENGVGVTQIPTSGLTVIAFQVWWELETEPLVWRATLLVQPEGESKPKKWEEYQSAVFARLNSDESDERTGTLDAGRVVISGSPIVFTGEYLEVPVTSILSPEDVLNQLLVDLPSP